MIQMIQMLELIQMLKINTYYHATSPFRTIYFDKWSSVCVIIVQCSRCWDVSGPGFCRSRMIWLVFVVPGHEMPQSSWYSAWSGGSLISPKWAKCTSFVMVQLWIGQCTTVERWAFLWWHERRSWYEAVFVFQSWKCTPFFKSLTV